MQISTLVSPTSPLLQADARAKVPTLAVAETSPRSNAIGDARTGAGVAQFDGMRIYPRAGNKTFPTGTSVYRFVDDRVLSASSNSVDPSGVTLFRVVERSPGEFVLRGTTNNPRYGVGTMFRIDDDRLRATGSNRIDPIGISAFTIR
jgi:hypothetical protein